MGPSLIQIAPYHLEPRTHKRVGKLPTHRCYLGGGEVVYVRIKVRLGVLQEQNNKCKGGGGMQKDVLKKGQGGAMSGWQACRGGR